jgi:5-dehydro-2-deoxygluconokinase
MTLQSLGNDKRAYDLRLRPALMVQAIHELQDAGVEADVWKIEGIDRQEDCDKVVAAARRDGRQGRLHHPGRRRGRTARIAVAEDGRGFTGFAVVRTTFWDPLVDYRANRITRDAAVARIAASYREWVDLFEKAKSGSEAPVMA